MPPIFEHLPLPTVQQAIFSLLALFVVTSTLITVLARNLFHNALGLVATLFGISGLYFLLEAEFLGISQVLVYVGAIATLITFAIMLTRGMMFGRTSPLNRQALTGGIMAILFFIVLLGLLFNVPWPNVGAELADGEAIIAAMGESFVTTYLVPFQLMALLLLVALAGAIMLARDDL